GCGGAGGVRPARAAEHRVAARRGGHARRGAGDRLGVRAELPGARGAAALARVGRDAQRGSAAHPDLVVAHRGTGPGDHGDGGRADHARAAAERGGSGMSAVLDVAGLTVSFPGVGQVLRGVDLRLEPGRCLAVVGESGAGKSVLARSVVGLAGEGGAPAHVDATRFVVAGQDVMRADERTWRGLRGSAVGFVLQDALQSLDPLRTVGAEVGESLRLRGVGRDERRRRVLSALEQAGLEEPALRAAQRSGELSGGRRQRALIASAVVGEPVLLVADEPTTALDATVARGVLELLGRLRDEGTAVLLVSHDLGAVARLADDVVVLDGGQVVEAGPAQEVLRRPSHAVTRALLDAVPRGSRRRAEGAARSGEEVLRATGLHHRYRLPGGGTVDALADVDLVVHRGEALGVVGESGSGESTLVRVLVAAGRPAAGQVELGGGRWGAAAGRGARGRGGGAAGAAAWSGGCQRPRPAPSGRGGPAAGSWGRGCSPRAASGARPSCASPSGGGRRCSGAARGRCP